jgi:hypothetical protein
MANLIGKNSIIDDSLGEELQKRKIAFTETQKDLVMGLSVTYQALYNYEFEGNERWAFEFSERISIDGYASYSWVFDSEPTDIEIIEQVNTLRKKNNDNEE